MKMITIIYLIFVMALLALGMIMVTGFDIGDPSECLNGQTIQTSLGVWECVNVTNSTNNFIPINATGNNNEIPVFGENNSLKGIGYFTYVDNILSFFLTLDNSGLLIFGNSSLSGSAQRIFGIDTFYLGDEIFSVYNKATTLVNPYIKLGGDIFFRSDNTYNIGSTGAVSRPRNINAGNQINSGGNLSAKSLVCINSDCRNWTNIDNQISGGQSETFTQDTYKLTGQSPYFKYYPGYIGGSLSTMTANPNITYYTPFIVSENRIIDYIGLSVTANGSGNGSFRIGFAIYNTSTNFSTPYLDSIIYNITALPTNIVGNVNTSSISITLKPGLYFLATRFGTAKLTSSPVSVQALPNTCNPFFGVTLISGSNIGLCGYVNDSVKSDTYFQDQPRSYPMPSSSVSQTFPATGLHYAG